ncbi:ABC transporter ATP-binding protein [Halopenitus persicus]|uniref:Molybdate/tungstate import ATP-binding protein WtpC n=1 Tax=Halopenitus persicus TaxID=1048396 RepID=A0A1H3P458_9EURY|nr:ABC transporter ATP-binding protein [Halopenitus persicus]SDY95896.1 putative spermidine/putrescine transport system ATP-binding protein/spermidine/putrescine transport system ATP-binding protein [Halopenitus persicus]
MSGQITDAQDVSKQKNVVELNALTKEFQDLVAVNDVTLSVKDGEILTLLGPSGCGKTTTLRMIAGFETPTKGEIRLTGDDVSETPPYKRDTGMVFQRYALFQHMTVADNIAFGLKMQGTPDSEIDSRVSEMLEMVKLSGLQGRYPAELSGGQQQRVALARSLIIEPSVLLLDEPLANLDKKLREEMRMEFLRLHEELDVTMVYVTHNQEEALMISDRMAVMSDGNLHQVGTPEEIYLNPNDEFVADFIGQATFLSGSVTDAGSIYTIELQMGGVIEVARSSIESPDETEVGSDVNVLFRPEKFHIEKHTGADIGRNQFTGHVEESTYLGDTIEYYVRAGNERIQVNQQSLTQAREIDDGDEVLISFDEDTPLVLPSRGQ